MASTDLELQSGNTLDVLQSDDFAERVTPLLPDSLPLSRFVAVAKTAIRTRPELADPELDQRSLFNALIACAQMGLPPDGKKAVLNVYTTKGVKKVQLLPMVEGVSDVGADYGWLIRSEVIYEADEYDIVDEPPSIAHKRARPGVPRGPLVAAYATATKDGVRFQVVLYAEDIAKRRAKAKTQNFWNDWPENMWRKSAVHALFRVLPKSEVDRMKRLAAVTADEPEDAVELLYGPDGTEFHAVEAPADQPLAAGDKASDDLTDAHGGEPQQAPTADTPAADGAPGTDDDEPEPQPEWAAAGQTVVTFGVWEGKTFADVASREDGRQWIEWALPRPAKFTGDAHAQLETFVAGALPELWAAHTARSAA